MDENSSSDDEVFSIEDREEYSDDEEAIDPLLKTMELIEDNADELDLELSEAIAEVEGTKSFQCDKCTKVCKSKGGLTRHRRSKHLDGDEATSTKEASKVYIPTVDLTLLEKFFKEIAEKLREEKFYSEEILKATSSLKPSVEFLAFVRAIFSDFCRKRNQDVLLSIFYKEIYSKWKSFFPSCKDQRAINLVLIHFPQKLVGHYKHATSVDTGEEVIVQ